MTIVTPSKWLANLVKESFLTKYPIKVINNGIDLEIFKTTKSNFKEKYNLQNKIMILGVASVWTKKKGFDYFIELSKVLNDSFKVVMVGISEKQKARLPKNILAISRTNNAKELAEIYSAADIFINPTLEDNYPTTNLEAIACGTKVLTFDTGGARETISKTEGSIIKKDNIKILIEELLKIKENNFKIGDSNLDRFCKNLKYKEYIESYMEDV